VPRFAPAANGGEWSPGRAHGAPRLGLSAPGVGRYAPAPRRVDRPRRKEYGRPRRGLRAMDLPSSRLAQPLRHEPLDSPYPACGTYIDDFGLDLVAMAELGRERNATCHTGPAFSGVGPVATRARAGHGSALGTFGHARRSTGQMFAPVMHTAAPAEGINRHPGDTGRLSVLKRNPASAEPALSRRGSRAVHIASPATARQGSTCT
jgi:hypothetical protein